MCYALTFCAWKSKEHTAWPRLNVSCTSFFFFIFFFLLLLRAWPLLVLHQLILFASLNSCICHEVCCIDVMSRKDLETAFMWLLTWLRSAKINLNQVGHFVVFNIFRMTQEIRFIVNHLSGICEQLLLVCFMWNYMEDTHARWLFCTKPTGIYLGYLLRHDLAGLYL